MIQFVRVRRRPVRRSPRRGKAIEVEAVREFSSAYSIGTEGSPRRSSSPGNCSLPVLPMVFFCCNRHSDLVNIVKLDSFPHSLRYCACVFAPAHQAKQAAKKFKGDERMPIAKLHLVLPSLYLSFMALFCFLFVSLLTA